jgi:hypothetical protein
VLASGVAFFAVLWLTACGTPSRAERSPLSRDVFGGGKHRGMSYAHAYRGRGYGSEASAESLGRLRGLGVEWISITPFGFQRRPTDPEIAWVGRGGRGIAETDDRLRRVTEQARALGMRVMLKPHLWLRPPNWPGTVAMADEAGWVAWFHDYREFVLHYARLAQEAGIESFCVGNELEKTSSREKEWRELIRAVRGVYGGAVTYGATFSEVESVAFWDDLDFIGVSAYFPLVDARSPSRDALVAAWRPVRERLAALAGRWDRKVVFTELGYRSADFGAWRHWEVRGDAPVNLPLQADAYAAFFEAVWPEPWFAGVYWWKWFSYPGHSGPQSNDYELEGKPAEVVVAEYYRRRDASRRSGR